MKESNGRTRKRADVGWAHTVQFYDSADFLHGSLARFLDGALTAGAPVLMLATPERREGVAGRLAGTGHDFERACAQGRIHFVDAASTLRRFMVGGVPDARRFRTTIGELLDTSRAARQGPGVRAYGEMVDLLLRDGNPDGALRLEELWNELGLTGSFSLLCAYDMGRFRSESHTRLFSHVCARHARVRPADEYARLEDDADRALEVCRLQQRAQALEAEIRRREALETSLVAAKADAERASRAKSDFLAIVSHELRTPLNAIIGYQDLMEQEMAGPLTATQRAYLTRIRAGADHLLRLIDQILNLSRIEAGEEAIEVAPVDLAALAVQAVSLLEPIARRKGLTLHVATAAEPVIVQSDEDKLRQILLNLLSNAVKFTAEGRIEIAVRANEDGGVEVAVRDTGQGIEAKDTDRIFEPFVQVDGSRTRRHEGSGLGLAVSRDLARLLGGEVGVRSDLGQGSVFTLRVPTAVRAG